MDFVEVETFLAVADTLNLTKAAENLYVSQSTVTHRLKKLEAQLQCELFYRQKGKRTVELSARGEEFLAIAHRWLLLQKEMERLKESESRFLSIASIDSVITTILPDILRELSQKKYGINVSIQTQHTPQVYELVRRREADIGFAATDANIPELLTEPVFRQKYVLIKPCRTPEGRKQIHPSELDPALEIFQPWGYTYMQWHNYWWPPTVAPHISIDSVTALTNFLDDESHWAIVQNSSLKTILSRCSIQVYDLLDPPPDWVCYKVTHRQPNQRALGGMQAFEEILDVFLKSNTLLP